MNEKNGDTTTWPDLAISLYDKLTGRGAEITYGFENLEVMVPSGANSQAQYANWKINGILKLRARDTAKA
jgi:hypothetical protein